MEVQYCNNYSNCVCVCARTGEPGLCSWYPGGYVLEGAGFESLWAMTALSNVQSVSWTHSASYSVATTVLFWRCSSQGMVLTTPIWCLSEAVPLLHSWCEEGKHSLGAQQ